MVLQNSPRTQLIIAFTICVVFTVACWWAFANGRNTWATWVLTWLVMVNVLTFAYYGLDKMLARLGYWRIPEVVLHSLSAIGGTPGALAAMLIFRHKTIKSSFRILFWSIAFVQIAVAIYVVKVLWWT